MPQNSQDITWRVLLFAYAPVLLWLGVIFYLSSGSGAVTETSRIVEPLLRFFFSSADEATIQNYHGIIRKAAHTTEYAILAALASRALLSAARGRLRTSWAFFAIGLVSLTAAIDELNQSYNAARTGSQRDVLIDICGGVAAVGLIWLFRKRGRRKS